MVSNLGILAQGMQVLVDSEEHIVDTSTLVAREYKRNGKSFFIDDTEICGELVEVVEVDLDSLNEVQVVDENGDTAWIAAEFLTVVSEVVKSKDFMNGGCEDCECNSGGCSGGACEIHFDKEFQNNF